MSYEDRNAPLRDSSEATGREEGMCPHAPFKPVKARQDTIVRRVRACYPSVVAQAATKLNSAVLGNDCRNV